jgi:serine/threonine protein kinase
MNPRQRDDTVLPPSMQQVRTGCLPVYVQLVNRIQHDAIIYDFENQQVHLCDLDSYRPGPYRLDRDRQCGSTRFMAPEESKRGATIDERTTVFTRTCGFRLPERRSARRNQRAPLAGKSGPYDVASVATELDPDKRFASVTELLKAWRTA